jgi:hypothetical protein
MDYRILDRHFGITRGLRSVGISRRLDPTAPPRITFDDTRTPRVFWSSETTNIESFKRAVRKAKQRGWRLLSFHTTSTGVLANFGA